MTYEIKFSALEAWDYPMIKSYQYDFIKDLEISNLLNTQELADFELCENWGQLTENHSTKSDNPIHILEVAKMVSLIKVGIKFPPVIILAESDINSGYCVTDGQHRLRAMKYLGKETFMADIKSGFENVVGSLVVNSAL